MGTKGKRPACAVTMVRDDHFFLERWVAYYGAQFGPDALYVVSHGGDPRVAEIAAGCSVLTLPPIFGEDFDVVRWRLLQGIGNGLRGYFEFVLVGDVDEFVVVDPALGESIVAFLARYGRRRCTLTPVGLEVVHLADREPEALDGPILGARRHCVFSTAYSKPCLFNHAVRLARGGHFATDPALMVPEGLYLFHMRFADAGLSAARLAQRQAQVAAIGLGSADRTMISRDWRRMPGEASPFDRMAALPVEGGFDFSSEVARMKASWAPRGDGGLYGFDRETGRSLSVVPERFFGIV